MVAYHERGRYEVPRFQGESNVCQPQPALHYPEARRTALAMPGAPLQNGSMGLISNERNTMLLQPLKMPDDGTPSRFCLLNILHVIPNSLHVTG